MKVLHLHDRAQFQGGVEQILFDIASSLSNNGEQGLLFAEGGSDQNFFKPFAWHGMALEDALKDFDPDVVMIHKVTHPDVITQAISARPSVMFVHDHDITCPRRHKYIIGSDVPCKNAVGISCIKNLCFVEKSSDQTALPIQLFAGVRRQQNLFNAAKNASKFLVASRSMRDELISNKIDPSRICIIPPLSLIHI